MTVEKMLKVSRIAVQALVLPVLGAGMVCVAWRIPGLWAWFEAIQLGRAIAVMSLSVFAVWILLTLIFGRIYCSTVCPLGTLMDGFSRAVGRGSRGREYHYRKPLPEMRYIALAVWAVGLVFGIVFLAWVLDPASVFSRLCRGLAAPLLSLVPGISATGFDYMARLTVGTTIVDVALLAVVGGFAIRTGRGLCNSVCPIGAILGMVSRYSIFQIDIDTDLCTQCRRCEYVCKSCCIDLTDHVVDGARCVGCFNCITVCPNKAIRYTTDRKRLSTPMMERIAGLAKEPDTEASLDMRNGLQHDEIENMEQK